MFIFFFNFRELEEKSSAMCKKDDFLKGRECNGRRLNKNIKVKQNISNFIINKLLLKKNNLF